MARIQGTSARSRQVCAELRKLRKEAGMTGGQVAKILDISPSKVSRLETGNRGLHVDDVVALLGLYHVPERRRDKILELVRKSDEQGWWQNQGPGLPPLWKSLIGFEQRATRIQSYELAVVPGLLQTAEYAGAIIQGINRALTDAELDQLVAARMARQALLRRRSLQFLAVVDEGVLHRVIGDEGMMRRQLRQLGDDGERPNITVRVVPLQAGAHAGLRGGFSVLDFAEEPSVVYIENHGTCLFLAGEEELSGYRLALNNMLAQALKPEESVDLIFSLAGRL